MNLYRWLMAYVAARIAFHQRRKASDLMHIEALSWRHEEARWRHEDNAYTRRIWLKSRSPE